MLNIILCLKFVKIDNNLYNKDEKFRTKCKKMQNTDN